MKLPLAENAFVERRKLDAYLLVPEHPQNQGKAAFWLSKGFSMAQLEDVERLELALLEQARNGQVTGTRPAPEGILYAVEGAIRAPDKSQPIVVTIWEIKTGSERPRFVTAYPV